MKNLGIILLMFVVTVAGCKKPTSNTVDNNKTVQDLIISKDFEWNTTHIVTFTIETIKSKVIRITSLDGKIQFHKGFYNLLTDTYNAEVTLPVIVDKVLINGKHIDVSGELVSVNLDDTSVKAYERVMDFPTDGLLALWHFNENTGTQAADSHGNYDGVVAGATWTPGINQSALDFDGIIGGVTIPSNPNLNIVGDEISLSFWFKMNEVGNSGCFMFHNTKYIVRIDNHGKVSFMIYNPTYKSIVTKWSDRIIDADWHNVTATYDGSNMKLFIDNQLMATKETTGNLNSRQTSVYIGNQSSINFFDGLIDEVALYDRALSIDEVSTIYSTVPNPDNGSDDLISWWPMDESSGTQVPDEKGINNGILAGPDWTTGVIGNCLDFNGSNDYVNIPNDESLNFANSLTIMAWANTRDYKEAKIAQKGDWDGHGIGGSKWNGWKGHIRTSNGVSESIEWVGGRPILNEWYHIAITYDGANLKMYINGQLNNTRAVTGTLKINNRNASIGSDNGGQKFFNGLIDEVKFFSSALTQTEIQSVFNGQTVANDTDGDGIPDADDDYPNDPARAFVNYFPASGYGSLAFEDLWPGTGDYDFNDLVVDYRFSIVTNAGNKVSDVVSKTIVRAIGAGFNNGYGFQFANNSIQSSDLTVTGYSVENDVVDLGDNGLEIGQSKPTIIVFDNSNNILQSPTGFGVNVEQSAPYVDPDTVLVNISFTPNVYEIVDLNLENFNPFIIINGIRGMEVHLPDYEPTDLADMSYFSTENDDSDPTLGRYYKSTNNLPWAINIAESFDYSIEKSEITSGYNYFAQWAESSGQLYPDWYKNTSGYRNNNQIYQVP